MVVRLHNPPNRFHGVHVDWEEPPLPPRLVVREESPRQILNEVRSPDIPFHWSLNPYRGCTHACAYCYARATHEYNDLSAGTDFERVVFVKRDAARLLAAHFERPSWRGEPVHLSGATDCYQPLERKLGVTRSVLEVLVRYQNPVTFITRSPLILRDLDLLTALMACDAVRVQISIPIIDPTAARALEPGAPPPSARLATVRALADAGVPVGVSLAPVIPGVNDHLLTRALEAAAEAGARWAFMGLVRLVGSVRTVFEERLREAMPQRAAAVLDRVDRATGCGGFGDRMRGHDPMWAVTEQTFEQTTRRLGLNSSGRDSGPFAVGAVSPFRRPTAQLGLFGRH